MGETKILSVHKIRTAARLRERKIQKIINSGWWTPQGNDVMIPGWARGVRVRKAGRLQWVVEVTSWKGH